MTKHLNGVCVAQSFDVLCSVVQLILFHFPVALALFLRISNQCFWNWSDLQDISKL